MKEVIEKLRDVEGIKGIENRSGTLKINLFSRPVPGSEAVEISGDLRKISQNIRTILEDGRGKGLYSSWEWMQKPEKKYQETKLGKRKVSDRKDKGHKPGFYRVSIIE